MLSPLTIARLFGTREKQSGRLRDLIGRARMTRRAELAAQRRAHLAACRKGYGEPKSWEPDPEARHVINDHPGYRAVRRHASRGGHPQNTLPSRNAAARRQAVISGPLVSWRRAQVFLPNASFSSASSISARCIAPRAVT